MLPKLLLRTLNGIFNVDVIEGIEMPLILDLEIIIECSNILWAHILCLVDF